MKQTWNDYEKAAEHGPARIGLKIFAFVLVASVCFGAISYVLGWFGETAQVAKEEFGPRAMLKKYEWFKDVSAQLEKKQADIAIYEQRLENMENDYQGQERQQWTREDREQCNVWQSEIAGVKASYNSLAADYNAQMAKFNWKFANKGDLPAGADKPLPREFKPYINQ